MRYNESLNSNSNYPPMSQSQYDMSIEGIKEVNYIYISNNNGQTTTRNEEQQSSEH